MSKKVVFRWIIRGKMGAFEQEDVGSKLERKLKKVRLWMA